MLTTFCISVLLSSSVARYIAAFTLCMFECLFLFELAARILDKNYQNLQLEFSGVSKETSSILDPHTSASSILKRHGRNLRQFVHKMGVKSKSKNKKYCKALCVKKQIQNSKRFF